MKAKTKKIILIAAIITVIILSVIAFIFCPLTIKYDFEELDNGTYSLEDSKFGLPCFDIPTVYKNKPVTELGSDVYRNSKMKTITVPQNIKRIRLRAFAQSEKVENVTLPQGLEVIEELVFDNCVSLTDINIPDSVTEIQCAAFNNCKSLTEIHIPAAVNTMGGGSTIFADSSPFTGCTGLERFTVDPQNEYFTAVDGVLYSKDMTCLVAYPAAKKGNSFTVPETVTRIDSNAFHKCIELENVILHDSIEEIGIAAFFECKALKEIRLPQKLDIIKGNLFYGCSALEQAELPQNLSTICDSAFQGCGALTQITIPNTVEFIGENAFAASGLVFVNIPENTTDISPTAFCRCRSLISIDVSENNLDYISVDGILFSKDMTRLLQYPSGKTDISDYHVPETVMEDIGNAFVGCKLSSLTYPKNLSRQVIFPSYCPNLRVITVPEVCADQILYFDPDRVLSVCYDYTNSDTWNGPDIKNKAHYMLCLDGGSFSESWPTEKTLVKDGYSFMGWSSTGCNDRENMGNLPEEAAEKGCHTWYAVFEEE